jgi:hypothetical protein
LSKAGTGSYQFDFRDTGAPGTYTLLTFGATAFSAADFSFINLAPGLYGSFSLSPGALNFTVSTDSTPPAIAVGPPSVATTASGPVSYNVTYTYTDANLAAVTLAAANVTLNATGSAAGTIAISGGGGTRTVTISNILGSGSLGISIAAGTASDVAGNLAPAAGPSATFAVDHVPPTIASSASASGTYGVAFN